MTCIRRGLELVESKRHSPLDHKCVTVAKDSGELSGCIIICPIPLVDQLIFRKVGFELSYRRIKGDVMVFSLYCLNNSMGVGDLI